MYLRNLKRQWLITVVSLFWLAYPNVSAAINLSTATQRTLEHNPQLQLYPYHVRAIDGQLIQASLKPNPRMNIDLENALGTGDTRFLAGSELTLSLSQVLELGNKIEKRMDVVDQQSEALQRDYAIKRLDVVASMMRDYYDTLRLQYLIEWNEQRIKSENEALQVIKHRAKAGVVGQADVMRMELRLAKSQAKQAQLTSEHLNSLNVLSANWVDKPDFDKVEGVLSSLPKIPSDVVMKAALKETPDYLLSAANSRINEARLSLAKAESKADVTVGAGIRRLEATNDNALVFSFSMPLQWNDRNQGNIASAHAQYEETLATQEILIKQLEIALGRIQVSMKSNLHHLERLQSELQPVADSLLSEVKRGYQLGQYGVLQWVDAQDELFNFERERIEAQHAVHLQFLELERLTGNNLISVITQDAAIKE